MREAYAIVADLLWGCAEDILCGCLPGLNENDTGEDALNWFKDYALKKPEWAMNLRGWRRGAFDEPGQTRHLHVNDRWKRVPKVRSTRYVAYQDDPNSGQDAEPSNYALRYHRTNVVTWDTVNSRITVNTGGYTTRTTLKRINSQLPFGWRVFMFRSSPYWFNNRIEGQDTTALRIGLANRRKSAADNLIEFQDGDYLDPAGSLYRKNGTQIATIASHD